MKKAQKEYGEVMRDGIRDQMEALGMDMKKKDAKKAVNAVFEVTEEAAEGVDEFLEAGEELIGVGVMIQISDGAVDVTMDAAVTRAVMDKASDTMEKK